MDHFLVHNVRSLDNEYNQNILKYDFDERVLLQPTDNDQTGMKAIDNNIMVFVHGIVAVAVTPSKTTPLSRPQAVRRPMIQPPSTPSKGNVPPTPMSKALQSTSWLMQTLKPEVRHIIQHIMSVLIW